ncbi:MAG: YfcE family phosphodiesterase [Candidatus Hermodarchaeota archaeon]
MKLLIIGDPHIPRRATQIPPIIMDKLFQLTSPNIFDYTFFTGDLIKAPDFIQFLKIHTKKDVFIVLGNMDYYGGNKNAPISQMLKIKVGEDDFINIGLTHGHQISPRGDHSQLELLAQENNYNLLISGHTHKEEVFLTDEGILLINPGSVTGAWSFIASGKLSFAILEIEENKREIDIKLYSYDSRKQKFEENSFYYTIKNNKIIERF